MEVAPVTIPAHDAIAGRKRKADAQDTHNERLSKRLSLLNLGKVCAYLSPFVTLFILPSSTIPSSLYILLMHQNIQTS